MTGAASTLHPLFTIGHSNLTDEAFLALLEQHGVQCVLDVRSSPHSKFNPQFNQGAILDTLEGAGIRYKFAGKALGARREEASCYRDGVADYGLIAEAAAFREGIEKCVEMARDARVALMCAEKDPLQCHRFMLICRHLKKRGVDIHHILSDGALESQSDAEVRMLQGLGLAELDLFRTEEEVLDEAYDRQGAKTAYRQKGAGAPEIA